MSRSLNTRMDVLYTFTANSLPCARNQRDGPPCPISTTRRTACPIRIIAPRGLSAIPIRSFPDTVLTAKAKRLTLLVCFQKPLAMLPNNLIDRFRRRLAGPRKPYQSHTLEDPLQGRVVWTLLRLCWVVCPAWVFLVRPCTHRISQV